MGLEKILQSVREAYEEGAIEGFGVGYEAGFEDGVNSTKNIFKPAVSDGLRCKSSECGRAMNHFKK